jgi:hypothetical protein
MEEITDWDCKDGILRLFIAFIDTSTAAISYSTPFGKTVLSHPIACYQPITFSLKASASHHPTGPGPLRHLFVGGTEYIWSNYV